MVAEGAMLPIRCEMRFISDQVNQLGAGRRHRSSPSATSLPVARSLSPSPAHQREGFPHDDGGDRHSGDQEDHGKGPAPPEKVDLHRMRVLDDEPDQDERQRPAAGHSPGKAGSVRGSPRRRRDRLGRSARARARVAVTAFHTGMRLYRSCADPAPIESGPDPGHPCRFARCWRRLVLVLREALRSLYGTGDKGEDRIQDRRRRGRATQPRRRSL